MAGEAEAAAGACDNEQRNYASYPLYLRLL
jgi:hypothetical protein